MLSVIAIGSLLTSGCGGPELRGGLPVSACVPSSTLDQAVLFSPGEVELLDGETLDEVIISFVDEPVSAVQVGAGVSNLNPGDVYTLRTTNSAPIDVRYGRGLDIEGPANVPLALLLDVPGGVAEAFDVAEFAVVIDGRRVEDERSGPARRLLEISPGCDDS